jgi:WD40 repeat protein
MATVYLANDLKHDRKVAIKVLKPELAAVIGADRFLVEIKTTAQLQHPHILPLFDSGNADSILYYVMPYVEGETLRSRLDRETQLPIDDAIRLTREVADALDYAHRHGVIHRDIKPENILLHDGRPVVADFGIALALSAAAGGRMTETGMSLGTPHYMSPEQATADKEITGRSDIYSLGSVLYEMLAGEPPHLGNSAQQIIMKIIAEEAPSVTKYRKSVPEHVAAAVAKAIEKLPADRFATAKEFADALGDPNSASAIRTGKTARGGTVPVAVSRRRRWIIQGMAAVTLLSLGVVTWALLRLRADAGRPTTWQYLGLPDSLIPDFTAPFIALSPDGTQLVTTSASQDGGLFLKRDDALEPVAIPGTRRAGSPEFSPDGQWILYNADGKLKKVRVATGTEVIIADSVGGGGNGFGGGAWLDDGTVVYAALDLGSIRRVDANGGPSTLALDNRELQGSGFGYPTPLPGARGVLFVSCTSGCATMSLRVLDLRTGKQHLLLNEVGKGWYLPTGHVLYTRRDGTLLAAPFDLNTLQFTGAGVPVLSNVLATNGFSQFAWSPSGVISYATGVGPENEGTYFRVTRAGVATPIDPEWKGQLLSLALSPDGRRMAVGVGGGTGALNIWTKELDRGPFTRLSFSGADRRPVWSPDGKMVAFIRDTLGSSTVFGRYADGSRPDTMLWHYDRQAQGVEWSRTGDWLVIRTDNSIAGAGDLVGRRLRGDTTPVMLVASPFTELHPVISNDGKWLAYTSNESGRNEVYVRPFPNTNDGRWQISTAGGYQPRWSADGTELFFIDATNWLQAARIITRPAFSVAGVRPLFDVTNYSIDAFHSSYVVTPDGKGFIFGGPVRAATGAHPTRVVRADRWFKDLREKLAQ